MDHNEAEDILNNADLRKRSYTENLALLNYQMAEIRTDFKEYGEHQRQMNERLWGAIEKTDGRIGDCEKDIVRLQERQGILAVIQGGFTILVGTIAGYFGVKR